MEPPPILEEVARSQREDRRTRGLVLGVQGKEVPGGKANEERGGGATEAIEERTGETMELFVPTGEREDVNPGSGIHRGEDRRDQGAVRPDRGMGGRQSGKWNAAARHASGEAWHFQVR
ncbi:hypothetical protein NDU88_006824 [Pleurodeles waltl]|uniref:Uncharacterized protein n=1 Tax=Pleurodeles waltl TaxID=8319 RepID=A0AAV7PJV5_PLEWA|nr:hypothetical protein NDU88_006824 [Pleurodeles waltl]